MGIIIRKGMMNIPAFEPYVYSCSSDKLQMEYQVITRIQRFAKKGKASVII